MRNLWAAVVLSAAFVIIGSAGHAGTSNQLSPATPAAMTPKPGTEPAITANPRCRCVERHYNGSCKRRICRDHWPNVAISQ